jgi:hypothetical protein
MTSFRRLKCRGHAPFQFFLSPDRHFLTSPELDARATMTGMSSRRSCTPFLFLVLSSLNRTRAWIPSSAYEHRTATGRSPMWAKQTPRILSAGNEGAAHFQCALRLRGGSSSAPSFSYAASSTRKPMISAAATSLLAGSLAGAVGCRCTPRPLHAPPVSCSLLLIEWRTLRWILIGRGHFPPDFGSFAALGPAP